MKRWQRSYFWILAGSLLGTSACDDGGSTGESTESTSEQSSEGDDDDDDATTTGDGDGTEPSSSDGDDDDDDDDASSDDSSDNHPSDDDDDGDDDDDDDDDDGSSGDNDEDDDDDDGSSGDDDDDETSSTGDDSGSDTGNDMPMNICDETVPSEHHVDGFPSYGQCDTSKESAIWSNDGHNTATEQLGSDWQRTQWGAGYQCTEYATRYMLFKWGVMGTPNGNAGEWCDGEPPDGMVKTMMPVHGDLMVFAGGSCGASQQTGHVAVVDIVHDDEQSAEFVEQNGANRRTCKIDTAACFLHAVAND